MKLINKLLYVALLALPIACDSADDDANTRWACGSDRFDADMDGDKFYSGHTTEPASVVVSDSAVTISFHGEVTSRKNWHNKWDRRTLSFTFPLDSMKLNQFSDLVSWDSLTINLGSKDSCLVEWKRDYRTDTLDVRSGVLNFNRSRLIGVDGDRNSVFLSGDFSFRYVYEDLFSPDTVSIREESMRDRNAAYADGWFDVVITGRNFEKK